MLIKIVAFRTGIFCYTIDNFGFFSITINDEFTADETELKKMKKYSITSDKIKIDFPPEYIGDKVYPDPKNEDIVIIKSKLFADKLRAEQ